MVDTGFTLKQIVESKQIKGHGELYDPQLVLAEFKNCIRQRYYKKQAYFFLAKKYNKSMQHIRRIVREAQIAQL